MKIAKVISIVFMLFGFIENLYSADIIWCLFCSMLMESVEKQMLEVSC